MAGSGDAELQQSKWLGDMCEGGVEKIRITAGDTMIIPAGYIHAVVSLVPLFEMRTRLTSSTHP